jgi:hypothetical protein
MSSTKASKEWNQRLHTRAPAAISIELRMVSVVTPLLHVYPGNVLRTSRLPVGSVITFGFEASARLGSSRF